MDSTTATFNYGASGVTMLELLIGGTNYAATGISCYSAKIGGSTVYTTGVATAGNVKTISFNAESVEVTQSVAGAAFVFEVTDASAGIEQFRIMFPVKEQATLGGRANGTYSSTVGMALVPLTDTFAMTNFESGAGNRVLGAYALATHGIIGSKVALIAATHPSFDAAIAALQQANKLPYEVKDGRLARRSYTCREWFLSIGDLSTTNVADAISYANAGGFRGIMIGNQSWMGSAGHFLINTTAYPNGLTDMQGVCDDIHAAGLGVAFHTYGLISSGDTYVTGDDARLMRSEGTPVTLYSHYLPDPATTLPAEVAGYLAGVMDGCEADLCYLDALDNVVSVYTDDWFFYNTMFREIWEARTGSWYMQSSIGTGIDLAWHLFPRAATSDGGYDLNATAITTARNNDTIPEIGWYWWENNTAASSVTSLHQYAAQNGLPFTLVSSIAKLDANAQTAAMLAEVKRSSHSFKSARPNLRRLMLRQPGKPFEAYR